MSKEEYIISINGGSSSIKFALYKIEEQLIEVFHGEIENMGTQNAKISSTSSGTQQKKTVNIQSGDRDEAIRHFIDWLEKQEGFDLVIAIGHRIVHGMKHIEPEIISPELIKELKEISAFDPEHLPEEIKLIEIFSKCYPSLKQIACFDTSFHTSMPTVAKLVAIPRRYYDKGIQRYGFHGLSYTYLLEELKRVCGNETAKGKIILAHLGNGASLAAVKDGISIDTSMGFTPTSGIPMGTRTGDLDPGVAWYLMEHEQLAPTQFNALINHESGLLGISETSSDMRTLLEIEGTDERAREAIEMFCYQAKKCIGAYTAVLGGLDVLVFSGGIGEHSSEVRRRICVNLGFLGIDMDEYKNRRNEFTVSTDTSNVKILVIRTNEEFIMAKMVRNVLISQNGIHE